MDDAADRKVALRVEGLAVAYGAGDDRLEALRDIDFEVFQGEFLSIVGPSGCGKTTLLKCISGLMAPTRGRVLVDGAEVSGPPRKLAMVFQDYTRSLMPWLTVEQNVTFPLRAQGAGKHDRARTARRALESVGLGGFERQYPWQLSGGMQQRVAIARAVAYQPEVLLMDEPFASVDAQVREDLEDLVLRIHQDLGTTFVLVTHDIDESVYLSSRVVVLSARPTVVRQTVEVPLAVPRDQLTTRATDGFVQLRSQIMSSIRAEKSQVPATGSGTAPHQ